MGSYRKSCIKIKALSLVFRADSEELTSSHFHSYNKRKLNKLQIKYFHCIQKRIEVTGKPPSQIALIQRETAKIFCLT